MKASLAGYALALLGVLCCAKGGQDPDNYTLGFFLLTVAIFLILEGAIARVIEAVRASKTDGPGD